MYTLPNLLTISRIVVIPAIFLSVYITSMWWAVFAAVLFIIASITDYFVIAAGTSTTQVKALADEVESR